MEPNLATATPPTDFLLPPTAYTDPAWLDREIDLLFDDTWTLVSDAAPLAAPGSYLATKVGRSELLLVRAEDGVLRAFHNLCRHRGMVMIGGCGSLDRHVACTYYGWRFALDGRLQIVPQRAEQFPNLVLDEWGLLPASVAEWEGMVFAHPAADAPDFFEAMSGLPDHIGSYHAARLPQLAHVHIEGRFNWKLFVENHVDVYHLWYLHEQTLGAFDHTVFQHWQLGRNWASYEPLRRPERARTAAAGNTVPIRHIDDRDRLGIGAHMIWPNTLMATSDEFFVSYAVHPIAPDRSYVDLRVRGEADADADALVAQARAFIDEDVAACEGVQAGFASRRFRVGPLARTHEAPITRFHEHLLAVLDGS